MDNNDIPKLPVSGAIYGEIATWMLFCSMAIAVYGFVSYMIFGGHLNNVLLLNHLWGGCSCDTIWSGMCGLSHPPSWYSCLGMLHQGDMLATLGIAVGCSTSVVGTWGAFLGTWRSKEGVYVVFSLVIAITLTLSALGVVHLEG